ncbi:geranylgeranylglycerol-phosphate geranylgeranyltransferase [Flavobacterium psychrophilum]|uniref:geranylgeranylglycerol-phosphate geranylgeranyltransferase n=1 Tax=Flavobacterium psychrophilum TaxID=96345 RepID=UPI000904569F|nr:geranylgeranylglycerol-phosphate geranylgeranyltransferase [Flavobacterium psychrophilum]EKT4550095.1 geranylgeranylglycerol-phosphate geranylgeranyltransferase [Flavobacterium psychrophilum]ELI6455113.1 geranylgeranylglycerol-phosphate geranylgeranyltransferase [Flavobacterium psychrophilum]ELY2018553.1 geranylgeranylglycerol-phosphate geranylgeranyltransferase [Flavobacterium psychrophilum]MCB6062074.1 geranylgeranylglycerol-phosphate geranylgeranyltransferase [Flavobacterium psychrophilum
MLKRKSKLLLIKIFSLFSVVRGYNIPVVVLAQYLSSIFILSPEKRALDVILDWRLFLLVFVSTLTISSGYIINNFYDSEKDLINRPNKTRLDRQVSQTTKLQVYFVLNFLATALSLIISFRAALFFATYIFLIWFYSHKLKKYPIVGNLTASLLAVLPFFGILLYFKNFYHVIFAHAMFLFLLLFIREMIKDLENIKGDIANNYQTIPVRFGERVSKQIITFLTISTIIPVYILIEKYDVGYMDIYFYISLIILILFLLKLWKSQTQPEYVQLHVVLKILIVAGVFCIVLINPSVLINGKALLKL